VRSRTMSVAGKSWARVTSAVEGPRCLTIDEAGEAAPSVPRTSGTCAGGQRLGGLVAALFTRLIPLVGRYALPIPPTPETCGGACAAAPRSCSEDFQRFTPPSPRGSFSRCDTAHRGLVRSRSTSRHPASSALAAGRCDPLRPPLRCAPALRTCGRSAPWPGRATANVGAVRRSPGWSRCLASARAAGDGSDTARRQ
jgi:hypothetical protein